MDERYDFYTGFEGEPELLISSKDFRGEVKVVMNLWIGYFDSIMNLIPPNSKGKWEGVPLHYHLLSGWDGNLEYKCNDANLFAAQLQAIDRSKLSIEEKEIHGRLLNMLRESVARKEHICFELQ